MVQYFDEIPTFLLPWIAKQKVFWVATAPLGNDGLVNLSPKGVDGTFTLVNSRRVWYEDLSGSGVATVAHVRENGRITLLFNAFEGFPRILRLYGKGTIYEFGTPEYEALLSPVKRHISSRAIVMLDVIKVATSCGWGVPLYEYKGQRNRIMSVQSKRELVDFEAEASLDPSCITPPRPKDGLKHRWLQNNSESVDGLPGLLVAPHAMTSFARPQTEWELDNDQEFTSEPKKSSIWEPNLITLIAFLSGAAASATYIRFMKTV